MEGLTYRDLNCLLFRVREITEPHTPTQGLRHPRRRDEQLEVAPPPPQ